MVVFLNIPYLFSKSNKVPLSTARAPKEVLLGYNCLAGLQIRSFRASKHTNAIRGDLNGRSWSAAEQLQYSFQKDIHSGTFLQGQAALPQQSLENIVLVKNNSYSAHGENNGNNIN
jgi:hypothetical protein